MCTPSPLARSRRPAPTGRALVELHEAAGTTVLTITDDGPGIPVQQRQAVFERFTRLEPSRSREAGGTGLGLAIVQDIVTRHRGHRPYRRAPNRRAHRGVLPRRRLSSRRHGAAEWASVACRLGSGTLTGPVGLIGLSGTSEATRVASLCSSPYSCLRSSPATATATVAQRAARRRLVTPRIPPAIRRRSD